jgi:hypothetical protein
MKNVAFRSLAVLLVLAFSSAVYPQTQTTSLEPGKSIEQTIAGGETHVYNLTLAAGLYILVEVDQKSINLAITIFVGGQKLRGADLAGISGSEQLSLIGVATNYRIEVSAPDKAAPSGGYVIKVSAAHPATDQDKARVEAEKLTESGMQILAAQRTHESRLEAIDKFQRSRSVLGAAKN